MEEVEADRGPESTVRPGSRCGTEVPESWWAQGPMSEYKLWGQANIYCWKLGESNFIFWCLISDDLEGFLFAWLCLKDIMKGSWLETCFLLLVSRMPEERKVTGCCFLPCPRCPWWADVRWVGSPSWVQATYSQARSLSGRWRVSGEQGFPETGKPFQGDPEIPLQGEVMWPWK